MAFLLMKRLCSLLGVVNRLWLATVTKPRLIYVLGVCNARSLNNKIDELEVVIKQRNGSIAIISEWWDITTESSPI